LVVGAFSKILESAILVTFVVSAAAVVSAAKNVTPRERIAVSIAAISRAIRPITGSLPFEA
jgi:hypothetical protein